MRNLLKTLLRRNRPQATTPSNRVTYGIEDYPRIQFQAFVPGGFDETPPANALEILERTKALFIQERNWQTSAWFSNKHPELDPEDAFCNDWHACMDGALVAVSIGCHRFHRGTNSWSEWFMDAYMNQDPRVAEDPTYQRLTKMLAQARRLVSLAATYVWPMAPGSHRLQQDGGATSPDVIASYNDKRCGTRTEAIKWLDKAIELAHEATGDEVLHDA